MNETEKPQFSLAITALLETMGQEATTPRLAGFWMGLRDLSLVSVQGAVASFLATSTERFPPSPGVLRELATGGPAQSKAIQAWGDVCRAIPLGAYKHIDFADRAINATIRHLGGWPALFERCGTADSEKWYRIEFEKSYAVFASRGFSSEAGKALPGLSEVQVIGGKVVSCVPVQIGCNESRQRLTEQVAENFLELRTA